MSWPTGCSSRDGSLESWTSHRWSENGNARPAVAGTSKALDKTSHFHTRALVSGQTLFLQGNRPNLRCSWSGACPTAHTICIRFTLISLQVKSIRASYCTTLAGGRWRVAASPPSSFHITHTVDGTLGTCQTQLTHPDSKEASSLWPWNLLGGVCSPCPKLHFCCLRSTSEFDSCWHSDHLNHSQRHSKSCQGWERHRQESGKFLDIPDVVPAYAPTPTNNVTEKFWELLTLKSREKLEKLKSDKKTKSGHVQKSL